MYDLLSGVAPRPKEETKIPLGITISPPVEDAGRRMPYLGEVGTEEFLMKLTSQITEMVSAKISQGESKCVTDCSIKAPK